MSFRPEEKPRGAFWPALLVALLVVTAVVAVHPGDATLTLRRMVGIDGERLAAARQVEAGTGSYSFLMTQRGRDAPVAYDPCRTIEVVINPDGAPPNWLELVDTSIERTEEATGLVFDVLGTTDRRDFALTGVGARRKPVLVGWATPDELPALAGDVAGIAGSVAVEVHPGRLRYVTGTVTLDRNLFEKYADSADDQAFAQAIVDHEFAHLVGLGHVDDERELMNEDNLGVTAYGPGDLEGLARLGSVRCD
ncbi:hypothetical protein [Nocardioides sp.]|uniref:hypothetical protein n=1 Tax=Nocardioides sp. TaxID=35761 RepID=UPI00273512D4|nr:hypothetical protein [Nocardioides sp.]MDP3894085.1 hypothetical protein [Nocardioides sp.]